MLFKQLTWWHMLWQPYQTNTGDIPVKVKVETMTLENIAQSVCSQEP